MTRPIQYACDPANRYCECQSCELPPVRHIDLDGLIKANREIRAAALFAIFLAIFLSVVVGAFVHADRVQEIVAHERRV